LSIHLERLNRDDLVPKRREQVKNKNFVLALLFFEGDYARSIPVVKIAVSKTN
jgi:hypothetical protein